MLMVVFPASLIGRHCREGVKAMKVICMLCKQPAEIPNELLDIIINASACCEEHKQNPDQMAFCCDRCITYRTDELADHYVNKVLFRNANQN